MASSRRTTYTAATASRTTQQQHDRNGAVSPTESILSTGTAAAGAKRKERDYESNGGGVGADDDSNGSSSTNINVVVRCRGRNDREVRENSPVVVSTEGAKGKLISLSMGPNALSDKTYNFDRVFSQAADQSMIFDDVVKPILEEMISGYNCTIFAYGQTGTGKTYTMSGDMTETMGYLSDGAGIIPRVLYALFNKLEMDEMDSAVKCSFIELYNEELRDLISAEESTKLKIYEDTSRKGHTTTVVQGMEECYIKTASEGIKILQEGSLKRQVAATKCNDLSSRSHTVFTITAYVKRSAASGDGGDDDYVSAGKLNLVDLAGSENIQRSGAENKRAAEAGLINKSLLTLGRVINALVDHSPHIPYRESKLTRLLQDSLGGRTKTCIIATISPARSNLEETISTLDYAFRAKNIRNKPQTKALISKKALLRDFASEIERLKGELIATRQRNGVYLSNEQYEAMTVEAESRRILTEEQLAKIETLESNLRNKVQELFALTSSFMGLRKEHDATRAQLDETRGLLDQTELVLATTRRSLAEETHLRMAHQETEAQLTRVGDALLGTLRRTVTDVGGLHAKDRRRSDLQSINRASWQSAQETVASATSLVESRVAAFQQLQQRHVAAVEERMRVFVRDELAALEETQRLLDERLAFLESSKRALVDGQKRALDEANETLDDVATVRDAVRESVGSSLQSIASAAQRIAADVLGELATLHTHLHESYAALGRDLRQTFEDLLGHVASQRAESDKLRHRLCAAGGDILRANDTAAARVQEVVDEERRLAADERATLMAQIAALVNAQAERQEARLAAKAAGVRTGIEEAAVTFDDELKEFGKGTEASNARDDALVLRLRESRDAIKARLQNDWNVADKHSTSIQETTESVHAETVRIVNSQIDDLGVRMAALDDFVARAREQNESHHADCLRAVEELSDSVGTSYGTVGTHYKAAVSRMQTLDAEMETETRALHAAAEPLHETLGGPLASLRKEIQATRLQEYEPTGDTPARGASYEYPTTLPRTEDHDVLIARLHDEDDASVLPKSKPATPSRPSRSRSHHHDHATVTTTTTVPVVFSDPVDHPQAAAATNKGICTPAPRPPIFSASLGTADRHSLREVNPNSLLSFDASVSVNGGGKGNGDTTIMSFVGDSSTAPLVKKKSNSRLPKGGSRRQGTPAADKAATPVAEGRENVPPAALASSLGAGGPRRKSPRLN